MALYFTPDTQAVVANTGFQSYVEYCRAHCASHYWEDTQKGIGVFFCPFDLKVVIEPDEVELAFVSIDPSAGTVSGLDIEAYCGVPSITLQPVG